MKNFRISKSSVDDQKPSNYNTIRLKNLQLPSESGRKITSISPKRNCNNSTRQHDYTGSRATTHALDADALQQLYELVSEFSENFSQAGVLKKLKTIFSDFLKIDQFILVLRDSTTGVFSPAAASGINMPTLFHRRKIINANGRNSFATERNGQQPPEFEKIFPQFGSLLVEPFFDRNDEISGYLALYRHHQDGFSGKERHFITKLNAHLGHIFDRIEDFHRIQQQSITDSLTQIPNRRYFDSQLKLEIERSSRYNHPLTLLMIDIDHFKRYNDKYGHPVGDVALKNVVFCLREILREGDFLARYGGEEFMVILPESGKTQGMNVAEKLRLAVQKFSRTDPDQKNMQKLTISIGVASLPENSTDGDELIEMVDQALYWAKSQGRNCTADYTLMQYEGKIEHKRSLNVVE